jgi:LysM domain
MSNNKPLHFPTKPIVMRRPDALGPPHPLSKDYVPPKSAAAYTVKDGDSWESVAKMHGLSARALIAHNFKTTEQDYVNFYLQRITGCNKTYDDINWAFSGSATPGKVYIPVSRDERDPYVRYGEIIPRIDRGPDRNERLAKILHVLNVVGVQEYRRLWYYDSYVVARFLDKATKHLVQQRMTHFTNGNLPFDGIADYGMNWKVYPFQELIERWATRYDLSPTDSELAQELVDMDSQIYRSWMNVQNARDAEGVWGHLAYEFIDHVNNGLSKSKIHLYSAYR